MYCGEVYISEEIMDLYKILQLALILGSVVFGVEGQWSSRQISSEKQNLATSYQALLLQLDPDKQQLNNLTFKDVKDICDDLTDNINVNCAIQADCLDFD